MGIMIQIGTNNGNDRFRKLVLQEKPDLILLVEPNISLRNSIEKNYENIPNVHIISKAITWEDNSIVSLYYPAINGVEGNVGKNGITYHHVHFSMIPMNDWGDKKDMIEIKASGISFMSLCKEYNITEIEYLQIDTEGFDSEIIKMIDLNKIKIDYIRFEKWTFDTSCFTKHNEKESNTLGIAGMEAAKSKLVSNGYELTDISDEDGNDILATRTCPYFRTE
jgi:FkbM family methyltransferase